MLAVMEFLDIGAAHRLATCKCAAAAWADLYRKENKKMVFPHNRAPKHPVKKSSLKPCPMCGSRAQTARMLTLDVLRVLSYMAWCPECGYYGPLRFTKRGAVRAWNRRKETPDA